MAAKIAPGSAAADPLPGLRPPSGRPEATRDVVEAIRRLNTAGIPACIVGVRALRYYGAGRVTNEWDICVPTDQLADAEQVFHQADDKYEPCAPPPPVPKSLRHASPTFKSKEADFHLLLTPSRWQFLDPARPGTIERDSRNGLLPYPRLPHLARALLVLQNGADVADLIDGMDLDAQWGEAHLDFEDLQARALPFLEALNEDIKTGAQAHDRTGLPLLSTNNLHFRKRWNDIVEKKPMRIEPLKQGQYKTRWRRIQDDSDPRTQNRPV